jgi:site-specific recombinase XerD
MRNDLTLAAAQELALIPHGATADRAGVATLLAWSRKAAGENPDAYSANTWRAYRASWSAFCAWAVERSVPVLPAAPEAVAAFLRHESEAERAVGTVKHRAVTISVYHRRARLADPCQHEDVQLFLRGMAKSRGTDQRQAKGLVQRAADRIADRINEPIAGAVSLKDLRDLALLLVGRDLLARANELVALTVDAVTINQDGIPVVRMRRCKTDTASKTYPLGLEAYAALQRWRTAAGITEGPLFRAIGKASKDRDGAVRDKAIGVRDVTRAIKRLAGEDYSSHSMRVGMAKDLANDNHELPAIMQAGGWKSPEMVSRYIADEEAGRMAVARYHADRAARRHK